jgi:hypothetical protein
MESQQLSLVTSMVWVEQANGAPWLLASAWVFLLLASNGQAQYQFYAGAPACQLQRQSMQ